jgi:hypothetical protein
MQEHLLTMDIGGLNERLRRAEHRRRLVDGVCFAALMTAGAFLTAFIFFLGDYITRFPGLVRVALTAALVYGFAYRIPQWWRSVRVRKDEPADIAREVEQRAAGRPGGGLLAVLVSGMEFAAHADIPGSTALKSRVRERATQPAYDPLSVPLHDRTLLRMLRHAGPVALIVLVGWLWIGPHSLGVFALRSLGLPVEYRTDTRIVEWTYPAIVPEFEAVEIVVVAEGELPSVGRVRVYREGEAAYDVSLDPVPDRAGAYTAEVDASRRSFEIEARLGDAPARRGAVRVMQPAAVEDGSIQVIPPEYTGLPPDERALGHMDVPAYSRLTYRIRPDRPVAECWLELNEERMPMERGDDGVFTFTYQPPADEQLLQYSIKLVDENGVENRRRASYAIHVTPDRPPLITMSAPEPGEYYAPSSRLTWRAVLTDDYGLKDARLHYTAIAINPETGEEQRLSEERIELGALGQALEAVRSDEIVLREWAVTPGRALELVVWARDHNPHRAEEDQWVASAPRLIHVVTEAELRAIIQSELMSAHRMLRDIRDDITIKTRMLEMMEGQQP